MKNQEGMRISETLTYAVGFLSKLSATILRHWLRPRAPPGERQNLLPNLVHTSPRVQRTELRTAQPGPDAHDRGTAVRGGRGITMY